LNGQKVNVIQLPKLVNGMTVTTTPIPPVSRATTIIPVAEMNDVNNTFKLVNIPQNLQQITKFPVWEIPRNSKKSTQADKMANKLSV
jgi:hypothetical protein